MSVLEIFLKGSSLIHPIKKFALQFSMIQEERSFPFKKSAPKEV
jgi:hypothetical protein